jgi:hypothetical protein
MTRLVYITLAVSTSCTVVLSMLRNKSSNSSISLMPRAHLLLLLWPSRLNSPLLQSNCQCDVKLMPCPVSDAMGCVEYPVQSNVLCGIASRISCSYGLPRSWTQLPRFVFMDVQTPVWLSLSFTTCHGGHWPASHTNVRRVTCLLSTQSWPWPALR